MAERGVSAPPSSRRSRPLDTGYSAQVQVRRHLLVTGSPGVGKTTLLRRVARRLSDWRLDGFLTEEMRGPDGRREGFRAVTFAAEQWTIAHVSVPGPTRVGRYGVDLAAVDRLAEVLERAIRHRVDLCLIDEIGKMECLSGHFVAAVERLLDADLPVLATVALRGGGLIAEVKRRPDVELWQLTWSLRDELVERAARWLASSLGEVGSGRGHRSARGSRSGYRPEQDR